jgi:hypothetical protein
MIDSCLFELLSTVSVGSTRHKHFEAPLFFSSRGNILSVGHKQASLPNHFACGVLIHKTEMATNKAVYVEVFQMNLANGMAPFRLDVCTNLIAAVYVETNMLDLPAKKASYHEQARCCSFPVRSKWLGTYLPVRSLPAGEVFESILASF